MENHFSDELPGINWRNQKVWKSHPRYQGEVDLVESVDTEKVDVTGFVASDKQVELKEMSRIRLHDQDKGAVRGILRYGWGMVMSSIPLHTQHKDDLCGMAVYHQRVYVVHGTCLIVYCYTPDGSLSHKYEHKGREKAYIRGMCLMIDGDTAMLVVCDWSNKTPVWIRLNDDVTMDHHHTQRLDYIPSGSYNDRRDLMVCDPDNHKLHRYTHDGQTLAVIKLRVWPHCVTRHDGGDQYAVSDWWNNQVVMIDARGQVNTQYKGDIHSVELGAPRDVITDPHRGVLIPDHRYNQVLLLRRTGDVVNILDQHVIEPYTLYLDTDHDRLHVSGKDKHYVHHVFVFNYALLAGGKEHTMKITNLDMRVGI